MAEQSTHKRGWWRVATVLAVALVAAFVATGVTASQERPLRVHGTVAAWLDEHPGQPVPLIIEYEGDGQEIAALVREAGGTIDRRFDFMPALQADVPADLVSALGRHPEVSWLSLDAPVVSADTADEEPLPDPANLGNAFPATVNAPQVWGSYAGAGVSVAVIDSGISDNNHPDFARGSSPRVTQEVVTSAAATNDQDGYGHGTHVAGLVGGDGSLLGGRYAGVAPLVNLIDVKVSDDAGNASVGDVMAGLQWVDENAATYNIKVVNLSLTSTVAQSYKTDPLDAAVELLWLHDVAVVVSAGNLGSASDAVNYAPANDPFVIVVGASDDQGTGDRSDDLLAPWSSRGTTQDGFAKPDLVVPGRKLVSDIDPASVLATTYPDRLVDGSYFRMSGTSMAAGVMSGVVALVREAHPDWLPGQVKYVLRQTSTALPGNSASLLPLVDQAIAYSGQALSADDGLQPNHRLLAAVGVEEAVFNGVRWRDKVEPNGVRWRDLEVNGIRWGGIRWGGIRWGNIDWSGIRWGSDTSLDSTSLLSIPSE